MSKFKLYPEYKDSGIEWVGKVPACWQLFPLKRVVDGCINGLWGEEARGEGDSVVIRVADFDYDMGRVSLENLTQRWISDREYYSRSLCRGDLLLEKSGGGEKTLVGRVVLYEHDLRAVTSNFVARLRSLKDYSSKYLYYVFFDLYEKRVNHRSIKQTTGIQNLDTDSYLRECFYFPPHNEQKQIALFLDHETARMDELIAEQKRLIELLKEKRQAVISHAVTKGLDPNAPMKDSGIEWLGEVPEHWQLFPLKKTLEGCINGVWGDEPSSKRGIVVIRVADFDYDRGLVSLNNLTERNISEHDYYSRGLRSGDLLIEKSGGGAKTLVGRVVFYDHDLIAVTSNFVARLRPGKSFLGKYLYYVFSDLYEKQVNHRSIKQTTGIQNLDTESYLGEHFYFPLYKEQKKIAEFLDNETRKIDALIQEAEKAIELMNERRSALISAAVTGKIDVRDWQPEKEQVEALAS